MMSNCGMIYGSLGMIEVVHVASSTCLSSYVDTFPVNNFHCKIEILIETDEHGLALGVLDEFSVHAFGYCESDVGLLWICD